MADHGEMSVKYHTATHLLDAALRKFWVNMWNSGEAISRPSACVLIFPSGKIDRGTKETSGRFGKLRHCRDYPVSYEEMTVPEAKAKGAIGLLKINMAIKSKYMWWEISYSAGCS